MVRYSLIIVLIIGLYFFWNENQILKKDILIVNNNLQDLKYENVKLHQEITQLQAKLQSNQSSKISIDQKKVETAKKITQKQTIQSKQKILIVLPDDEKQYHQIVPKIEYKNIDLKGDNTTKTKQNDDLRISPELFIDKDEKRVNGARIEIETKF